MSAPYEVVIVGAGIAGGALATVLARQGRRVLLLEKTTVHVDRVRGEYLQPWGVAELKRLGLLERVLMAGANVISRTVFYDENTTPLEAEKRPRRYDNIFDGIPGCLGFGHPQFCDLLNHAAVEAGAVFLRGIRDLDVTPGTPPRIAFMVDGARHEHRPLLVVGADGRGSQVGRLAGISVSRDEPHHLFAGLLVDGVPAWSQSTATIGTEGQYLFFVAPQGGERLRLYLGFDRKDASRFAGPAGVKRFLREFSFAALPSGVCFADGKPAGPVHTYSNEDQWSDTPAAPGVVLVGDAAGFNDPLGGQGLSLALRDVRVVSELLAEAAKPVDTVLRHYVEKRRDRMRRLRLAVAAFARLRVEFGMETRERRRRVLARTLALPELGALFGIFTLGPEHAPASAFEPAAIAELMA
jgi:menaquinone-9 beta-reductase